MASMYKDICESEEFLSNVNADRLLSLLGRDDLSAPSETFVFKSVMQWIKHKKEERMAVAGKVIEVVRLGLVDIRVVIEELNTEDMQRIPEVHTHLHEVAIYQHMPSHNSKFATERTKPRSTSQVRRRFSSDFYLHQSVLEWYKHLGILLSYKFILYIIIIYINIIIIIIIIIIYYFLYHHVVRAGLNVFSKARVRNSFHHLFHHHHYC